MFGLFVVTLLITSMVEILDWIIDAWIWVSGLLFLYIFLFTFKL